MFYNQKTNEEHNGTLYHRNHKFGHKTLENVRDRDLHTRQNRNKKHKDRWKINEMNTEATECKKEVENQRNEHRNYKTGTVRNTTNR